MSNELWYTLLVYFIRVIIILALVFALTESSRKYDRFRNWPQLIIALGYFLLLIWALLQALMLEIDVADSIAAVSRLVGFLCLGFGYIAAHEPVAKPAPVNEEAAKFIDEMKPSKKLAGGLTSPKAPPPPKLDEKADKITKEATLIGKPLPVPPLPPLPKPIEEPKKPLKTEPVKPEKIEKKELPLPPVKPLDKMEMPEPPKKEDEKPKKEQKVDD